MSESASLASFVRHDRAMRWAAGVGAGWLVVFVLLLVLAQLHPSTAVVDLPYLLPIVVAVGLAIAAAVVTRGRTRTAWALLAVSTTLWLVGEVIWVYYAYVAQRGPPAASSADFFYLASYVFAIPAILVGIGSSGHLRNIRGLLDAFEQGVEKVFIYSLVDDVHRSPPRYHGLIDGSMRPRPAFHSVKNLMALFADQGRDFTPRTLAHRLSGVTGSIKRQLFQKSDGSFLLTMYQDVDSYDRMLRRDTVVAPVPVGLQLAQPASMIQVFNPSIGRGPIRTAARVSALTIPVGDHVTVVRILV